jgi:hypothetical protein
MVDEGQVKRPRVEEKGNGVPHEEHKAGNFKQQMETLRERSDRAKALGPPAWLTAPWCEAGPLSADELR